jgi:hypothetical protein
MTAMTDAEIEQAMDAIAAAHPPEIVLRAARVLFAAGWQIPDFGLLILTIRDSAVVCDTKEQAEAVIEANLARRDGKLN